MKALAEQRRVGLLAGKLAGGSGVARTARLAVEHSEPASVTVPEQGKNPFKSWIRLTKEEEEQRRLELEEEARQKALQQTPSSSSGTPSEDDWEEEEEEEEEEEASEDGDGLYEATSSKEDLR